MKYNSPERLYWVRGEQEGAQKSRQGKNKIEKVMSEYKHGDLKSSAGSKVKSRKQAVAIALSQARDAGAKIPMKKAKSS